MRPAVSVIMPTYQHERYIGSAIRSVLGQTRGDWELVVVDDGSTDRTAEVAASFSDDRISLLRRPHRGLDRLGEAYADALAASVAPLVAVLEGDDEWPTDKLRLQLPAFEEPSVVLAYGAAEQIDSRGCRYGTYQRRPNGSPASNRPIGSIVPHLLAQNFIVAATVVIRRSALEEIGGFWQPEGIPYVDHPTWLRLALRGSFAYSDEVVGHWRRHPAQFTTSRATGEQPDNGPFLREMLREAATTGLISDPETLENLLADAPRRQGAWTDVARLRLALLNGSMQDAMKAAQPLLRPRPGWPKWATLATIGLCFRAFGSDLEWIFRATDRFSWPPRRHRHDAGAK